MKLQDHVNAAVRVSHRGRCLLLGCYYGIFEVEACVYCGTPKSSPMPAAGVSSIVTLQEQIPVPPDFDQLARDLVDAYGPEAIVDRGIVRDIAEELRLAWNARGAVDIAKLEAMLPLLTTVKVGAMEVLNAELRALDR